MEVNCCLESVADHVFALSIGRKAMNPKRSLMCKRQQKSEEQTGLQSTEPQGEPSFPPLHLYPTKQLRNRHPKDEHIGLPYQGSFNSAFVY